MSKVTNTEQKSDSDSDSESEKLGTKFDAELMAKLKSVCDNDSE